MRHTFKTWAKEQEDFIRISYLEYTDEELAFLFDRTKRSVKEKRVRLGLFRYFQESHAPIKGELWLPLEDGYEVSNKGRVRNSRGHILTPQLHSSGYVYVPYGYTKRLVHRLVAKAFLGECPEGYEVNHKDRNKLNNSVYNLEYVTRSENMKHMHRCRVC